MVRQSLTTNVFNTNIKGGIATGEGDGANLIFLIPHGMSSVPSFASANPSTEDAFGSYTTEVDATNIILTYQVAPPNGTDNLGWIWTAIKAVA